MTETVAPSEGMPSVRTPVEPHKISQAIGAAPTLDPSVGDKTVEPSALPSQDALEKASAARADLADHQPFVEPVERDDFWQPGDAACAIHACPYRAENGSRCRDHAV
jgi:hypothetical protein